MALKEEIERQGNWLFRWRSYLPLLILPLAFWAAADAGFSRQEPGSWDVVCFVVSCLGLAVRVLVAGFVPAGTSGRNVAKQEASRLNSTGIYSTMRHPLYVGNFLMALGVVLFLRSPWFTLVFALAYGLYYERIMFAEEEFLRRRYRAGYEKWAARTPAVIPSFSSFAPLLAPHGPAARVSGRVRTGFRLHPARRPAPPCLLRGSGAPPGLVGPSGRIGPFLRHHEGPQTRRSPFHPGALRSTRSGRFPPDRSRSFFPTCVFFTQVERIGARKTT